MVTGCERDWALLLCVTGATLCLSQCDNARVKLTLQHHEMASGCSYLDSSREASVSEVSKPGTRTGGQGMQHPPIHCLC